MSGSLEAVDSYIDTLQSSGDLVGIIAQAAASTEAANQSIEHDCPNPHCQKKRITPPVVTDVHFTRIASVWGFLPFVDDYTGYLNFNWTADMWCE